MPSLAELHAQARQVALELALTAAPSAGGVVGVVHSGKPSSVRPPPIDDPVERFTSELDRAHDDVEAVGRALRRARGELDHLRRRSLSSQLHVETATDLRALVVDRGQGFTPLEVSVALRCTPTFVRRARVAAGVEPERGRAVRVNGGGVELGVELIAAGMSVRAASAVVGVPRSTLNDRARR